jgi:Tol biopolymer transport system component
MRRLTVLATVAGMMLFGLVAVVPTAQGIPPANGKIAFNLGGPNDSVSGFTVNPDGTDLQQIVGWDGSVNAASWSPDGKKILASAWSDFFPGVQPATANPDGSGFRLLYQQPLFAPLDLSAHFWSPGGTRLLCHSEGNFGLDPGLAGLYTVRSSDGGDLVRVTTTPQDGSNDVGYGYSPDGSRILFARFDQNNQGVLYSVKPNGRGILQLSPSGLAVVSPPNFDEVGASWSPDGSQVTFAASWKSAPGRQFALYVANADGSHLRQITPSGVGALSAQWSPNGRLIAFSSKRPSETPPPQVWVVHPDGTALRQLTFGSSASLAPVWSPDSQKLLFQTGVDSSSLWNVNADGTGLTKLTDGGGPYAWGTAPVR